MAERPEGSVRGIHKCPAPACELPVNDARLACRTHWYQLPQDVRDRIWANYFPGQTLETATALYLDALREAVNFWNAHA